MADDNNSLDPVTGASLAAGATAALGAVVFKAKLWKGILVGAATALVTKTAIDKYVDKKGA